MRAVFHQHLPRCLQFPVADWRSARTRTESLGVARRDSRCGCPPGPGLRDKPGGSIGDLAGSTEQGLSAKPKCGEGCDRKGCKTELSRIERAMWAGRRSVSQEYIATETWSKRNQSLDGLCVLSLFLVQIYLIGLHMHPPSWCCPSPLLPSLIHGFQDLFLAGIILLRNHLHETGS